MPCARGSPLLSQYHILEGVEKVDD